jgi:tRNA threonylcarbamoyladenosine biosynthesis protein TsaE
MIETRTDTEKTTRSFAETVESGKQLANVLKNRDVVVLSGVLGAGKTSLIKGLATGLGIESGAVKSPSYTLVNEYHGRIPLFHLDLYRMKDTSELINIGWDDYLSRNGIVVIEWGEKAGPFLPSERIEIIITIKSENTRHLSIRFIN